MKYLVIIQLSSGMKNATIFESLTEAKDHLSKIASNLKYPIEVKWEDDECISAKITQSDWIKAQIIKTERAEYRLVRHTRGEKDEERRFSIRENAVNYVVDNYDGATNTENNHGEWTMNPKNEHSFKLYTVVLDPEKGSRKVIKRFNAATSHITIFDDIKEYIEENDIPYENKKMTTKQPQ